MSIFAITCAAQTLFALVGPNPTDISPSKIAQKSDGFSSWQSVTNGMNHDGVGAHANISTEFPYFISNRLAYSGFPDAETSIGAGITVIARQDNLGGPGVPDMYLAVELWDGVNPPEIFYSESSANLPENGDWVVIKFPVYHSVLDWSQYTVTVTGTSGLTYSSDVVIDDLWVEPGN